MRFEGAVFDIDGTLLDSMFVWEDALHEYLIQNGVALDTEAHEAMYIMSVNEGVAYLHERYGLGKSPMDVKQGFVSIGAEYYKHEVVEKPGVPEFLEGMKQRGIRMVLATSGDRALFPATLQRCGLWDYFENSFTCDELHTSKREGLIYKVGADSMGLPYDRVAVFEDVLHGIKVAKEDGFIAVAAEDPANSEQKEEIRRAADWYISDYTDLTDFWKWLDEE